MELLHRVCCGLDVHKKNVVACLRRSKPGEEAEQEVRTFATTTRGLLELQEWLIVAKCTHVAMESTGVYWRPVYNILEGSLEVLVVNARHIKAVPGRKTDVKDCEWIADLLAHGLLQASFVPPKPIRELRELTRHRRVLIEERARKANRVQKVLETANIKLGDVATDVLGVSGRKMLQALAAGERDPEKLADLAVGSLREKREELREALLGKFTEHHGFMLESLLREIEFLEKEIEIFDKRIEEKMRPFSQELERLDQIPGVGRRSAEQIIAELGPDMNRFRTAGHAASWAGICPGNNESAGKRRSGKTRKGNAWLHATLVECARAGIRKRDSYISAQYNHLVRRRGDKKAIVAVAHTILVDVWHMLRYNLEYKDLGANYFDCINRDRLVRYHLKRLESLGYQVTLQEAAMQ